MREPLKTSLRWFLEVPTLFLAEGRGFVNALQVIFRNPFLQASFPLGF
jgi:hypothetical protein